MTERPALNDLITLALEAGREIIAVREQGFSAEAKIDGSPVTIADQRAEAIIEQGLARLAPGVAMVGEEATAEGRIPDLGERFFCVDPLDGTRDFVGGGDSFTVNIALIERGAPVMGVVYAPASGELFAGEPGRALAGRFDGKTGASLVPLAPIRAAAAKPAQWRIVASEHSGRNERTARFIAALDGQAAHASSSIKFCRLAQGAADIYPRFGVVSEWDIAAGHAVLQAAGGGLMTLEGAPLQYGQSAALFLVQGFIAYANAEARAAALAAKG